MKAIFDMRNHNWMPDIENNILFLNYSQNYFNELLKARGYVKIFEVYKHLGLELDLDRLCEVKDPSRLWWRYDRGDFIDFGMAPLKSQNVVYLDFNIEID